jgi:hypothetical protein
VLWQQLTYDSIVSKEKSFKTVVVTFAALGLAYVLVAAMRGAFATDDDEDKRKRIMQKVFYYMVFGTFADSVPLVGNRLSYELQKSITGSGRYYSPRYFGFINKLLDIPSHIGQEEYAKAIWDFVQAGMIQTGLPSAQIGRIKKSIEKEDPLIIFGFDREREE